MIDIMWNFRTKKGGPVMSVMSQAGLCLWCTLHSVLLESGSTWSLFKRSDIITVHPQCALGRSALIMSSRGHRKEWKGSGMAKRNERENKAGIGELRQVCRYWNTEV